MSDPLLIFTHIPKTAGSTVHGVLEQLYPFWKVYSFRSPMGPSIDKLYALSENQKKRITVLKGHAPYGVHQAFPDRPYRYFTFLRDPVKRVLSEYRWVRYNQRSLKFKQASEKNLSLSVFLKSEWCLDNCQCRWLMGSDYLNKSIAFTEIEYSKLLKKIESEFFFIGIQDRFNESLEALANSLHIPTIEYAFLNKGLGPSQNETSSRDSHSKATEILEMNRYDERLYNHCCELLSNYNIASKSEIKEIRGRSFLIKNKLSYYKARLGWKLIRYW